jgi:hypothetical protein
MHLVTSLNMKSKIISKLRSIINFCSKTRTKPKPSSRIRTEVKFLKIILSGEKKKKSEVGGLTSSLPLVLDQVTSKLKPELGWISRTGT